MTYEKARELGEACGLTQPAEWVNNVIHHAMNLFIYTEIPRELDELGRTAAAAGVRFSKKCGDAVLEGESEDDYCYVCRKLRALPKEKVRESER